MEDEEGESRKELYLLHQGLNAVSLLLVREGVVHKGEVENKLFVSNVAVSKLI
jgi:hypothetical protein